MATLTSDNLRKLDLKNSVSLSIFWSSEDCPERLDGSKYFEQHEERKLDPFLLQRRLSPTDNDDGKDAQAGQYFNLHELRLVHIFLGLIISRLYNV